MKMNEFVIEIIVYKFIKELQNIEEKTLWNIFWLLIHLGCIHLLNTRKYFVNTCKYWDNTYKYWANTWKMCSPASVILTSIATILVSFEAILKRISVNFNIRSQFQSNFPTTSFEIDQNRFKTYKYYDNTCEYYSCRWTHFSSIGSILISITTILAEYILSQYLQVLSRWIHR